MQVHFVFTVFIVFQQLTNDTHAVLYCVSADRMGSTGGKFVIPSILTSKQHARGLNHNCKILISYENYMWLEHVCCMSRIGHRPHQGCARDLSATSGQRFALFIANLPGNSFGWRHFVGFISQLAVLGFLCFISWCDFFSAVCVMNQALKDLGLLRGFFTLAF